jgi:hypothetical protein
MKTKTCTKCKIKKRLINFHKTKFGKFGVASWCKLCFRKISKKYYYKHLDYYHNKNKKWRKNNKEKVLDWAFKKYNLTYTDYLKILKNQNGVCAICGQQEHIKDITRRVRRLGVDHNHTTGKFRGLLCDDCNNLLGRAKDNIIILKSAIKYLKQDGKYFN